MANYLGKSKLAAIGLGVCVVAIGAIIVAETKMPPEWKSRTALINTSMQVIGAAVIGGAAKFVADIYQRQKQKYDGLREFRGRIRSELVKAYS